MAENIQIEKGKYPADILNKIKGNAGPIINKSKATLKGALIGLGAGYVIALFFRMPKMLGIVGGSLAGALFADVINSNINKLKKCYANDNTKSEQDT